MHNESRALTRTQRTDFILSEDGVKLYDGDRVYNYYDMWPGTLRIDPRDQQEMSERVHLDARWRAEQVWCKVEREGGGGSALLNGSRLCSVEFAKDNGWPNA